jgi:uncharacterized protein (TIGR02996 family)
MSDEKALLGAIWEHPHEDAPRLVYADWLEEHGQRERAEFIRVQVELARMSYWDDSPRKLELLRAEERLKRLHGPSWRTEVPGSTRQVEFSRGFILPSRRLSSKGFLRLQPGTFDAAPQWKVTITGASSALRLAFASPLLARAVNLDLRAGRNPPDDLFVWLAGAEHLRHLMTLAVTGIPVAPSALSVFLRSAVASSIQSLWLNYFHSGAYRLERESLRIIAESPLAPNLRSLGLTLTPDGSFPGRGFPWPRFPRLKWLALDYSEMGDDGLRYFLTDELPAELRRLDLQYNRLTDGGARRLADWAGGRCVQHLVIVSNEITDRGAESIRSSPHYPSLKYLTWRW